MRLIYPNSLSTGRTRQRRPLGRRIQVRVFRVINAQVRFRLGLPVPAPLGDRLTLLRWTSAITGARLSWEADIRP